MNDYKNRIADQLLEEQLEAIGAILMQGPKWCGKTDYGKKVRPFGAMVQIFVDDATFQRKCSRCL